MRTVISGRSDARRGREGELIRPPPRTWFTYAGSASSSRILIRLPSGGGSLLQQRPAPACAAESRGWCAPAGPGSTCRREWTRCPRWRTRSPCGEELPTWNMTTKWMRTCGGTSSMNSPRQVDQEEVWPPGRPEVDQAGPVIVVVGTQPHLGVGGSMGRNKERGRPARQSAIAELVRTLETSRLARPMEIERPGTAEQDRGILAKERSRHPRCRVRRRLGEQAPTPRWRAHGSAPDTPSPSAQCRRSLEPPQVTSTGGAT